MRVSEWPTKTSASWTEVWFLGPKTSVAWAGNLGYFVWIELLLSVGFQYLLLEKMEYGRWNCHFPLPVRVSRAPFVLGHALGNSGASKATRRDATKGEGPLGINTATFRLIKRQREWKGLQGLRMKIFSDMCDTPWEDLNLKHSVMSARLLNSQKRRSRALFRNQNSYIRRYLSLGPARH